MSITFEITNNGVCTSYQSDSRFEANLKINRAFVDLSENYITIDNANDDMPKILRVFDEVSQEINSHNDMAWAHIRQPENRNSDICIEIHGTENAINMINHGLGQNDVTTILWV